MGRVLAVANTHYGPIEALPFDINHQRVSLYKLDPETAPAEARAHLVGVFDGAIRAAMAPRPTAASAPVEIRILPPGYTERVSVKLSAEAQTILLEAVADPQGQELAPSTRGRMHIHTSTT